MAYSSCVGKLLGLGAWYLLSHDVEALSIPPTTAALQFRSATTDTAVFKAETFLAGYTSPAFPAAPDHFEAVFRVMQLQNGHILSVQTKQAAVLAIRLYQTNDNTPTQAALELSLPGLLPSTLYRAQLKSRWRNDTDSVLFFAQPWSTAVEFETLPSFTSLAPLSVTVHAITPQCVAVSWTDSNATNGVELLGYIVQSRPLIGHAIYQQAGIASWENVEGPFSREALLALRLPFAAATLFCDEQTLLPSAYMLNLLHDPSVNTTSMTMPAFGPGANCQYNLKICSYTPGTKHEFRAATVVRLLATGGMEARTLTTPWSTVPQRIQLPQDALPGYHGNNSDWLLPESRHDSKSLRRLIAPADVITKCCNGLCSPSGNTTERNAGAALAWEFDVLGSSLPTCPDCHVLHSWNTSGGTTLRPNGQHGGVFVEYLERINAIPLARKAFLYETEATGEFSDWGVTHVSAQHGIIDVIEAPSAKLVRVRVIGAGGGSACSGEHGLLCQSGGHGAFTEATFPVASGDTLIVFVGKGGTGAVGTEGGVGGWPGGGDGGDGLSAGGGGGGGFSAVYRVPGHGFLPPWIGSHHLSAGIRFASIKYATLPIALAAGGGGAAASTLETSAGGSGGICTGIQGMFTPARTREERIRIRHPFPTRETSNNTGGKGGNLAELVGGAAGSSPDGDLGAADRAWPLNGTLLDRQPAAGRMWHAGRGASSYIGGGGGGGGMFGGGGGDSCFVNELDIHRQPAAGGGGGGCSYIHGPALLSQSYAETTSTLRVENLANRSTALTWAAQWKRVPQSELSAGHWQEVTHYVLYIEAVNDTLLSHRHLVKARGLETYSVMLNDLCMACRYRATLAVVPEWYGSGASIEFDTHQHRQPGWERLHLAHIPAEITGGQTPIMPSDVERALPALRGASVSVMNNTAYIFGGTRMSTDPAKPGAVTPSAAVIQIDTNDATWTELVPNSTSQPEGRERHIAQIYSGHLYIWGGMRQPDAMRTGGKPFSDMWRFALPTGVPGRTVRLAPTTYTANGFSITGQQLQCSPAQDGNSSCGVPERAAVQVNLFPTQTVAQECVQDITIHVDTDHPFPQQLGLELIGPYPMSSKRSLRLGTRVSKISRSFGSQLPREQAALEGNTVEMVLVRVTSTRALNGSANFDLQFQADSKSNRSECFAEFAPPELYASFPDRAHACKTRGDAQRFTGSSIRSSWALRVHDHDADGVRGGITNAHADVYLQQCEHTYGWEQITVASATSPRASADALSVAYEGKWYVLLPATSFELHINEMWAFTFDSGIWGVIDSTSYFNHYRTSFAGMMLPFMRDGASWWSVWGLGALQEVPGVRDQHRIWFYSESAVALTLSNAPTPIRAAFASVCLLDAPTAQSLRRVLVFGGQDRSSGDIVNSMWTLALNRTHHWENYLDMSAT
jgi:hypothetical protein